MTSKPSSNGSNGRGKHGQFAKGNPGGPGNPQASRVLKLRAALLEAVTPTAMKRVATKLVLLAEGGDIDAMRLLFDRVLGRVAEEPTDHDPRGGVDDRLRQFQEAQFAMRDDALGVALPRPSVNGNGHANGNGKGHG